MIHTSLATRLLHLVVLAIPIGGTLAPPAAAQLSAEISRAGHILRRMEFGASLDEVAGLLSNGTQTQTQLFVTYALGQLAPGPETGDSASLLGLYQGAPRNFPALGASQTPPLPTQPAVFTVDDLSEVNIALALYSPNQLREKMTQFWQRHFNTYYWTVVGYFTKLLQQAPYNRTLAQAQLEAPQYATYFDWLQNDIFRSHAMGNFRDLLVASAQSPAMLIYLDSVINKAPTANENYAREVQELHAFGVTSPYLSGPTVIEVPNYSYQDIQAIARAFSGWQLTNVGTTANPQFVYNFNSADHITTGPPGTTYNVWASNLAVPPDPGGRYITPYIGMLTVTEDSASGSEGLAILNHMAGSFVTANFVVRKLYRLFISEHEPPADDPLILQAISAWGPLGNINGVLAVLLSSARFLDDTTVRWDLARLPIEGVGQMVAAGRGRIFDPAASAAANEAKLEHIRNLQRDFLGQEYFRWPAPDGYPAESAKQLTTMRLMGWNRLRQEMYSRFTLTNYPYIAGSIGYDYLTLFADWGFSLTNESHIANFLCLVHFGDDQNPVDKGYLYDFVLRDTQGNYSATTLAQDFATNLPQYIARVTQTFAFAASLSLNNLK